MHHADASGKCSTVISKYIGFEPPRSQISKKRNVFTEASWVTVVCRVAVALRTATLAILLGAALPLDAQTTSAKFIPTFLVYYGGGPALVATDAPKLAKFDLINIDRFRYNNVGSGTWSAIKGLNPNIQIYLYQMGASAPSHLDGVSPVYLNGLGRHNVSRGHPQGTLNGNNPGLFLLDASGERIFERVNSNPSNNQFWYLMDFGSAAYHSYWLDAVKADIVNQPWVADGVFADNCLSLPEAARYSGASAWYSTNATWSAAMNSFADAITAGLHGVGQRLWCARSHTDVADGSNAWLSLDAGANPPDVLLEEGAFAVQWGSANTQFHDETAWKRQVDIMGAIKNSKVAMLSHTKLLEGQVGTDNFGKPVTYWQTLWYSLGSFLLGKNDQLNNNFFMFNGGSGNNSIWWHDEYDKIDLGKALGTYAVKTIGSAKVYWREFEKGYVYVNPTAFDSTAFRLPSASKRLTHDNLLSPRNDIANVRAIAVKSHDAAILLKSDVAAPSVPTGLKGTAVSSSQIDLSWNASTDDVGVTGYNVYLNNVPIATTASRTYQHTGRTAGTTYKYRVSAYDAVPNHSPWTAAISVTTPLPDTTPPSVPAGLKGTAFSNTQINLNWNASTDNIGVKGYYVYVNDVAIGATTATSFQHTGLSPGTPYNYRVSAYDAVPNHSAWTTTPVSVTTTGTASPPPPISNIAQFIATFPTNPFRTATGDGVSNDGMWWVEQKAGTNRATVVNTGRDGGTGLRLHTEPGDNNVSGSGAHERNDVALPQATTDGFQGREHWWAHSVLFPSDYAIPPSGAWATIFDFHDTRNQGGQANFHIFVGSGGGLTLRGHGGPTVVMDGAGNQYSYGADIGPLVKNVWYDFVYHVKWSSGSDGFFQAWVNGVLKLDHRGPTLYSGYGVYLKLANYHTAFGQSSSVIHDRVVRGPTALSVSPGPLEGVLTLVNGNLTALAQ